MKLLSKIAIAVFILVDIILVGFLILRDKTFQVLSPKGIIAHQEKQLLLTVVFLGLAVIIPTLLMFFFVALHYREGNSKRKHHPEWGGDTRLQAVFWIFPSIIVGFLIVLVWVSTHALDPFKPLESPVKPLTIQVVALQWKWLFIYPEYNIATVNYIAFPERTPITFELTADAPMNSFWIPRLGGQMYAMEGMVNKIHLMASEVGEYQGASAEISGTGFAGMRFVAQATTKSEFDSWVEKVKDKSNPLNNATYESLAKPSENTPRMQYSSVQDGLYNQIIMKYMPPPGTSGDSMEHMDMHDMKM